MPVESQTRQSRIGYYEKYNLTLICEIKTLRLVDWFYIDCE